MRWTLSLVILAIFLLAACQSAGSGDQPTPSSHPAETSTEPSKGGPDEPSTPEILPWSEATELILDGKVAQVFQAHSLMVILILKDGQQVTTVEPVIDEVFKVVEQCGDVCQGILLATE